MAFPTPIKPMDSYTMRRLLKKYFKSSEPSTQKELVNLLKSAYKHKLLNEDALVMIEGVIDIMNMQAKDIMIPKTQMVFIEKPFEKPDVIRTISEHGHSRYPVISSDHNEVLGILHAKDWVIDTSGKTSKMMSELIRPTLFIPESKRLDLLLKEFRSQRKHMAIVIDEYGSISGLVTIEDILEEIVGDIEDEYDRPDNTPLIRQMNAKEFLIQAQTPIEQINDYFNLTLNTADADTIAGLIIKNEGRIPQKGEVITLEPFIVKILRADKKKVQLIQLTLL